MPKKEIYLDLDSVIEFINENLNTKDAALMHRKFKQKLDLANKEKKHFLNENDYNLLLVNHFLKLLKNVNYLPSIGFSDLLVKVEHKLIINLNALKNSYV